jgi:hypothetical protein
MSDKGMSNKEILELLDVMFRQMQMQTGRAIRDRWFHDGEGCPGCGLAIKAMKFKGKNALSLNTFIDREHGVLIAYMLCGKCARRVIRDSKTVPPGGTTPLHIEIEKNLKQALVKHLGH